MYNKLEYKKIVKTLLHEEKMNYFLIKKEDSNTGFDS